MPTRFHRLLWIAITAVAACVVIVVALTEHPRTPAPRRIVPAPATSGASLVPDPIDGELVPRSIAERRPIGIMIDNLRPARPQWGLSAASRVYEALTEGGITRYLAVFSEGDADRVGPVRSARTQFLDYALELDAALGHVGGNADALALIAKLPIRDLNEFRYAAGYRRIPAPHVAFEHTMFTSTRVLRTLVDDQGQDDDVVPAHPIWKNDAPAAQRPTAQRTVINFSFADYEVAWAYRPETNDYARALAGRPDVDAGTGDVLTAKTIVVVVVPRKEGRTTIGEDTWTFSDLGSGPAWVLEDGLVRQGTWEKPARDDRMRIVDASGSEVAFNRGIQWVEIIPPGVEPSFSP